VCRRDLKGGDDEGGARGGEVGEEVRSGGEVAEKASGGDKVGVDEEDELRPSVGEGEVAEGVDRVQRVVRGGGGGGGGAAAAAAAAACLGRRAFR